MTAKKTETKTVGWKLSASHGHSEDLDDGRVLEPGEVTKKLDTKSEHNKRLIEEGALLPVTEEVEAKDQGGN